MTWEVVYTDEFGRWWDVLSPQEQAEISAKVDLLQEHGPNLPRPHSDVISSSKHANMKELRGHIGCSVLRILYAFDPRRAAILLIGGDKAGDPRWYDRFVPIADKLFDVASGTTEEGRLSWLRNFLNCAPKCPPRHKSFRRS